MGIVQRSGKKIIWNNNIIDFLLFVQRGLFYWEVALAFFWNQDQLVAFSVAEGIVIWE
jgi:hypothetical protein